MSDLTKRMQDLLSRSRYVPQRSESLYIEDTSISDDTHVNLSTYQPSSTTQIQKSDCQPSSTLSTFKPDALSDHLLTRLQAGSDWLTIHHQAWLNGNPNAADDERFSKSLAAWGEMERSLRLVYGYEGCIFGPDQRCPEDAPVRCDFCIGEIVE